MLEYHVPVTAGGVANIFDLLETNKAALNITNFLVSQTTLEEVSMCTCLLYTSDAADDWLVV